MLEKTLGEQPIDKDRITVAGISSGGTGSWELAIREPKLFAAVAPMASRGGEASRIDRIVEVPIWAFHSQNDPLTPIGHVRESVSALKSAGGIACLTELALRHHDCWHAAFQQ